MTVILMHLLVLSAFRLMDGEVKEPKELSQCTFWCSVLSDWPVLILLKQQSVLSQCTFWCSVLSDRMVWWT